MQRGETESSDGSSDDDRTTILVVDDEEVVRESFALYLEPLGYAVRTVGSGEAALAAVDDDVDVVLLDRRMPDRSGDEVLEEIRGRNVDCQIALVTAVDPDFDIVTIDCDDYLVKPVDRDDLVETVERLELLDEYDEAQRELSTLRVKRNVLEVEKHPSALEDSVEFRRLQNRIDELEAELDELESEFDEQLGYEDPS
ncbi:response regulator [Halosimplex pelagicum]|uniref:Response regulator n=1 Tax=Halosimplex pelagicum TaxID=869886 RepID=A0A7D5PFD7_9EURY|nr:response regulator [Halosimplex pelagicum]QLH82639.1 response regulator [Halosimplex pelagicum]